MIISSVSTPFSAALAAVLSRGTFGEDGNVLCVPYPMYETHAALDTGSVTRVIGR